MPRCQRGGAEIARRAEEIAELDRAVALDARDRRPSRKIVVGETVHHFRAEAVLVVENIMGDVDLRGDLSRVMNVLAGATGARPMRGGAMVVKLEGDADDVIALLLQQGGHDRGNRRRPTWRRRRESWKVGSEDRANSSSSGVKKRNAIGHATKPLVFYL